MRDIVSLTGTFYTGLSALPVIKTTQTSPAVSLEGFDGAQVYILAGPYTDGTFTPVIQVAPDNNGAPGAWSAVPVADLVAWQAKSPTDYTPVKNGNSQPAVINSAASAVNQRIGYIGGVQGVSDWLRVVTTVTGAPVTGCGLDIVIHLGRPRTLPSAV